MSENVFEFRPRAKRVSALALMADIDRGRFEATIRIDGEITDTTAAQVHKQLRAAIGVERLTIKINSNGGSVTAGLGIHKAIREHPARTKTARADSLCQSAAMLVFLGADHRVVGRRANLLVHSAESAVSASPNARWTRAMHQRHANSLEAADDAIMQLIIERTSMIKQDLRAEMRNEKSLDVIHALKMGIVHEIAGVTPSCRPDWPDRVRAVMQTGGFVGCPGYMFSETYLAACRALQGAIDA